MSKTGQTILIVDDDAELLEALDDFLSSEGYQVVTALAPEDSVVADLCEGRRPDIQVAVLDLLLPDKDGRPRLEVGRRLLALIRDSVPCAPVIVITIHASFDLHIDATQYGALDFLDKADEEFPQNLLSAIEKALMPKEADSYGVGWSGHHYRSLDDAHRYVGRSRPTLEVARQVAVVAQTKATVLILGERGSGKELLARSVHDNSSRKAGPFVAVDCPSIPETTIESHLFGSEKGAFTGVNDRKGVFERADGGTIFLDEVGDLSGTAQAKLLRVLQEREFERLGGARLIKVDVRVVAATNRDLGAAVLAGEFRDDLLDRLKQFVIKAPPLREKLEDLEILVDQTLQLFNIERPEDPSVAGIEKACFEAMRQLDWPGNVRQLRNVVRAAATVAAASARRIVTREQIEVAIEDAMTTVEVQTAAQPEPQKTSRLKQLWADLRHDETNEEALSALKQEIERLLTSARGNRREAAKAGDVSHTTFYKMLDAVGIDKQ